MAADVIGRDSELAVLGSFLDRLAGGAGAGALVLAGEAGVGKTTLWAAGVDEACARGLRVLQARPVEAETALSFSALGDLLDPVLEEALGPLPEPQRRALSQALLLEDGEGPPPEPHAIGVAVLGALRTLAASRPLVVAIDDVQWLDAASSGALAYAARRLRAEPAGLLLARRISVARLPLCDLRLSLPAERVLELAVGPLEPGALHSVVRHHLEVTLPRPLLAEVHQASGGNPFYALEIVRMLQRSGDPVEAGRPLPIPPSLVDLVAERLGALPAASRELLLAAAAQPEPAVALAEAASGIGREEGLGPALEAGIVELRGDRLRFTHPLLAAGVYEGADPLRRAQVHARLAELAGDPEARGRHLAASVSEPDEDVAVALADAARHARARGAPRAAALLLERARDLTPPERREDAYRRAVDAAYLHYESGDSPRAETQLRELIVELPPGPKRARALVPLARVRSYERQHEAVDLFLQAIAEAGGDQATLAAAHEGVAACLFRFRLRECLHEAAEHAESAAQLALELGDEALAAEATGTQLIAETLLGARSATRTVARALALQEACRSRRVLGQPLAAAAVHWWWTDEPERARKALIEMLERARGLGDESSLPYVLVLLGQVEVLLGELPSAGARARDAQQAAEQAGQRTLSVYGQSLEGFVEAELGRADRARAAALGALARVPETGGRPAELVARQALAHLELALVSPAGAVSWLEPAVSFARGQVLGEPGAMRFVTDHVEGLVELGRHEEAEELLGWYAGHARRLRRASALAACARCRGLLAASRGDVQAAERAYAEALEWHGRLAIPLDRGRTLLALGMALRRARRRREARERLGEALAVFEQIGAALWAERARAELKRISGRAPSPDALTPAEERVAALVAEGRTNREVAAALFLSERTVEGHLSRVFGKLGIRRRTELQRALAARQTQGTAPPSTGGSPVSAESVAP